MILIISQDFDPTTDSVIDWINYYDYPYFRINPIDLLNSNLYIDIEQCEFKLETNKSDICSNEVDSIWFRRWHNFPIFDDSINNQAILHELNRATKDEFISILRCLELCVKDKFWLNRFDDNRILKINQLTYAKEVGLIIPKSLIVNHKKELVLFCNNKNVITKATQTSLYIDEYFSYTNRITREILDEIPDVFFPSTFQVEIEKDIELRIVFLNGEFYPMAIFSQQVEQTAIDFRKYSFDTPNRSVPYKLPSEIETKLTMLMNHLNLNFGSIDMIKTKKNEYVFLEVNPVGQFGMVSNPCKYNIEQKIAQILIENGQKSHNKTI